MEHLNRIELSGNIGNIRISQIEDRMCARISLCTNHYFTNQDGDNCVETTWHNVTAWSGLDNVCNLEQIRKGMKIHVIGRLRIVKYLGTDGFERQIPEVVASQIDILED